jgi:AraC-like DNA-binding protein
MAPRTPGAPAPGAPDPLSDVLRAVRLRGALYFYVSCRDEWVAEAPPARAIADTVLPGTDHVLAYHMIAKGGGWAATDGVPPVRLSTGDIVMFPRGDAHVISSAPGLRAPHTGAGWVQATAHDPKPVPVTYRGTLVEPGATLPGHEADAVVVCGFIGCDLKPFNPLIDALPRMLHVEAGSSGDWIGGVLRQAVAESRERRAGSDALLERASEMVFVDAARRYLDRLPEDASGWLAGLRDRHVGRALGVLHADPAAPWTLDELSRRAGLSRSALHDRFTLFVGMAPMQYLARWRMQLAAARLRAGHDTIASIALDVGYESEAAFSRAFKRLCGAAPSAWRRTDARMPPTPDAPPAGRNPR